MILQPGRSKQNDGVFDIIFVKPDCFEPAATKKIAREIGLLNRKMSAEGRNFLLIGPGRWGTADHWLGIPVQWSDISNVAAIVEVRSNLLRADPSQGSHFFQNITSLGIPYLTINIENGSPGTGSEDKIDWNWFTDWEAEYDGTWVRHLRLSSSLTIKCEGSDSRGVIMYSKELEKQMCSSQE